MPVLRRIFGHSLQVGGVAHSGWLPPNAATPLPTSVRKLRVDLAIESEGDGFLLVSKSDSPDFFGTSGIPLLRPRLRRRTATSV
jgi:hypothetical protein